MYFSAQLTDFLGVTCGHFMNEWGKGYCMHAEHLESSAHASWEAFPDTLAVICGQDQVRLVNLTVMRI
jgi:hypothetical protein